MTDGPAPATTSEMSPPRAERERTDSRRSRELNQVRRHIRDRTAKALRRHRPERP